MESDGARYERIVRKNEILTLIYKTRVAEHLANIVGHIRALQPLIMALFIYDDYAQSKEGGYLKCELSRNGFMAAAFAVRCTLDELLSRERALQRAITNLSGTDENVVTADLIKVATMRKLKIEGCMVGGIGSDQWSGVIRTLGEIMRLEPELKITSNRDEAEDCILDDEKRLGIREVMHKIGLASAEMRIEPE